MRCLAELREVQSYESNTAVAHAGLFSLAFAFGRTGEVVCHLLVLI